MRFAGMLFATAALLLAAKPKKPDAAALYNLLKTGEALTSEEIKAREAKPDEPAAHIELLAYYTTHENAAARLPHILWLIDQDPAKGLGLFSIWTGVYRLHCVGDSLADRSGFERASQAWIAQVKAHPDSQEIFANAIDAIGYCQPEIAERMLIDRQDTSSADLFGSLLANAVLGLNGKSYKNNEAGMSLPELRESAYAKRAAAMLNSLAQGEIAASAASTLLHTGAELWADNKLDWDYTPLGLMLLSKAREAGAHSRQLLTAPTVLPARGERPPMTVRVGGNVQKANLVKKVTPRYPEEAKAKSIAGTVRMSALIGLDGSILDLEVVSGPKELIPVSLKAARQWMYKPTLLNGKPVYVITQIDINFDIR